MTFDTRAYETTHGSPRGFGCWGFYFDEPEGNNAPVERCFFVRPAMTYTAAKKVATAEATRRGASVVTVAT